ncbi:hypothetical protein IC582_004844 [Cucumis melo]
MEAIVLIPFGVLGSSQFSFVCSRGKLQSTEFHKKGQKYIEAYCERDNMQFISSCMNHVMLRLSFDWYC